MSAFSVRADITIRGYYFRFTQGGLAKKTARELKNNLIQIAAPSPSLIEPNLWISSPKNGYIAEFAQRLSAQRAEDLSNSGHRDASPEARSPRTAGFLAISNRESPESGLVGWGTRIRTQINGIRVRSSAHVVLESRMSTSGTERTWQPR
jgi:hypothetical protein